MASELLCELNSATFLPSSITDQNIYVPLLNVIFFIFSNTNQYFNLFIFHCANIDHEAISDIRFEHSIISLINFIS